MILSQDQVTNLIREIRSGQDLEPRLQTLQEGYESLREAYLVQLRREIRRSIGDPGALAGLRSQYELVYGQEYEGE